MNDLKSLTGWLIRVDGCAGAPYAASVFGSHAARGARMVRSYARWATTAKPGDYVIALSGASASVPVVGRHLEVLGGFAALGIGGRRYVSGIVAGMAQARLLSLIHI